MSLPIHGHGKYVLLNRVVYILVLYCSDLTQSDSVISFWLNAIFSYMFPHKAQSCMSSDAIALPLSYSPSCGGAWNRTKTHRL